MPENSQPTRCPLTFSSTRWAVFMAFKSASLGMDELTTTGRKSGQPRAVMLTAPLREGPAYVVVASRGGDDKAPAWLHNLRAKPDVEVALQGQPKQPMHARVATPEERARMWPVIAGKYKNYAGYQRKTTREIALVLLEPVTPH